MLLNNDTVVDPEFLTEMVKVAERDSSIAVAGAKIYYYDNPNQLWSVWGKINFWTGRPSLTPRLIAEKIKIIELDRGQYDHIREVHWVSGCCFLVKRIVVENIGLLDGSYFFYWEEADYCFRVKKGGYKTVYVPKAKIWHKVARSTKKVVGFIPYYVARNSFCFMKKHATKWQYRSFLIYFFGVYFWLATGYYLILCHSISLLTSFYRGVRDGVFNSEAEANLYIKA